MKPFSEVTLSEPNRLQKMMKIQPPENAFKELINVLAAKSFSEISQNDIELINQKYKTNLKSKYKNEIEKLLTDFMNYYLNWDLPNDGSEFIPALANILGVDKKAVDKIRSEVGEHVYRFWFHASVKNRRLSEEEENKVETLGKNLGLAENIADKISAELRGKVLQDYVDTIIGDGEISPEEDQELAEAAKSLKIQMKYGDDTLEAMERMRRVWKINHEDLPIFQPDVLLPKTERCHFIQDIDWYEYRKVRLRVGYAGPTVRIKIMKGVYYRAGMLGVSAQSKDERVKIDSGRVYLTNKRILFAGRLKNSSIQYSKIINIQPYKDGVDIIKDSGKSPFLAFSNNIHEFTATLTRLIANN